jgi:hypothetical protein
VNELAKKQIQLDSVDLIAVDGSKSWDRINLLIKIAQHNSKFIRFNCIRIFTGYEPIENLPKLKNIEFIPIQLSSISHYNKFILTKLHEYVCAEYCLIFQHDGFIINPQFWDEGFLEYDYIGALFSEAPWNKVNRVGNGGFSLRSKRFIEYCASLSLDFSFNEDKLICTDHYHELCRNGFTFAPPEIAAKFSLEEDNEYNNNIEQVFGFHGSSRRPHLYSRTLELISRIK